jgi:hypothetical protein
MTNRQLTSYVQSVSNPNLLDNPWFTVNQRGFTTNTANAYTVDRWKKQAGDGTITKSSDGITIKPTTSGSMLLFRQQLDTDTMIPYILGKTVTLSVMLSNGTIYSATGTAPITLTSSFQYLCYVQIDSVNRFVLQLKNGDCSVQYYNDGSVIPSTIITVKAVKLELGSVSTLAMDTAPNYQQELAKCQRYFVRYASTANNSSISFGAIATVNKQWYGVVSLPVVMRTTPTITYNGTIFVYFEANTALNQNVLSIAISNMMTNVGKLRANFADTTSLTVGMTGELQLHDSAYIDFSADL